MKMVLRASAVNSINKPSSASILAEEWLTVKA
jgi:hypothetical protein